MTGSLYLVVLKTLKERIQRYVSFMIKNNNNNNNKSSVPLYLFVFIFKLMLSKFNWKTLKQTLLI